MSETPLQPWRVTKSRHLLKDPWISVRADDCVTGSGVEISPYYVLEYPDWVHIVALDRYMNVIFVRQYRHAFGGLSLELPAGGLEAGETDVLLAAARELAEETQYGTDDLKLVTSFTASTSKFSNRIHVILALNATGIANAPQADVTEEIEVEIIPIGKAVELALNGGIVEANHISSLFLALAAAGVLEVTCRE